MRSALAPPTVLPFWAHAKTRLRHHRFSLLGTFSRSFGYKVLLPLRAWHIVATALELANTAICDGMRAMDVLIGWICLQDMWHTEEDR